MSKETFCRELNVDEGGTAQVGQEKEYDNCHIEEGGIFLPDYSSGKEEIITLEHRRGEDKIHLRLFPAVSIFEVDPAGTTVRSEDLPEPIAEFEIPYGEPFKMPIKVPEQGDVMLIVRDVPPDKIAKRGRHALIPLSLRHYN